MIPNSSKVVSRYDNFRGPFVDHWHAKKSINGDSSRWMERGAFRYDLEELASGKWRGCCGLIILGIGSSPSCPTFYPSLKRDSATENFLHCLFVLIYQNRVSIWITIIKLAGSRAFFCFWNHVYSTIFELASSRQKSPNQYNL